MTMVNIPPRIRAMAAGIVLREGGFADHTADPGGATQHGVSLRYARGIGLDLDGDGDTDKDDIRLVSPERAETLFIIDFFTAPRLDRLPRPLHPVMFDFAVHSGAGRAVITLQHVLNQARLAAPDALDYPSLVEDGAMGPKTRRATEQAWKTMDLFLINALVEERLAFLCAIVAADPDKAAFLRGWTRRAETFRRPIP
jgi:lysozyme family protein